MENRGTIEKASSFELAFYGIFSFVGEQNYFLPEPLDFEPPELVLEPDPVVLDAFAPDPLAPDPASDEPLIAFSNSSALARFRKSPLRIFVTFPSGLIT